MMDTDTIEELDRLREQNAAMLEALKAFTDTEVCSAAPQTAVHQKALRFALAKAEAAIAAAEETDTGAGI